MFNQFPGLQFLNVQRNNYFNQYNYDQNISIGEKALNFAGHKLFSAITLPANALAAGIGTLGMAASACTIGAFKVAVFALTLGNVNLEIPTGFKWLGERTISAIVEIFRTSGELIHDVFNFFDKCIQGVKATLTYLSLEGLYNKIAEAVNRIFDFIGERLLLGFSYAYEQEKDYSLGSHPIPVISFLNNEREKFISQNDNDRTFTQIAAHSAISLVSLPVNAVATACSLVATTVLFGAYCTKGLIFAATNLSIPVPTFVGVSAGLTGRTGSYLIKNTSRCLVDIPVTLYKASEATGLYQVAVKISEIIAYIPKAILGN